MSESVEQAQSRADTAPAATGVVTGGANGIGRAITEALVAAGHRVVIADMNEEASRDLVRDIEERHGSGRAVFVRTDVRREDDVAACIEGVVTEFGSLGWVVNNAGVGGAFGPIELISAEDWDYTFQVITRGVFFGVKHAARVLKRQDTGGAVLNIASVAGVAGGLGPQAYSAAKAAVVSLTKNTAVELAPFRIRVNAICPGPILTPLVHGGRPEETAALMDAAGQPWPDHGVPEDIAGAAQYLLSSSARFVTGASLLVDGGLVAMGPGSEYTRRMRVDPGRAGLVGVNRGTSGEESRMRRSEQGEKAQR